MVGSNGTILTMRLLRSKIRKRDDSSATPVHVESHQAVLPNETTPPVAYRQNSLSSVWVFPPPSPQPNLYNANSQDALMQNHKSGLSGFKKQLSGRFKRLVSRKHEPSPVIPPELKPQLKTIYVY